MHLSFPVTIASNTFAADKYFGSSSKTVNIQITASEWRWVGHTLGKQRGSTGFEMELSKETKRGKTKDSGCSEASKSREIYVE